MRSLGRGHGGLNVSTYFLHSAIRAFEIESSILRPWGLHKLDQLPEKSYLRIRPRPYSQVRIKKDTVRVDRLKQLSSNLKRQRVSSGNA